MNLSSTDKQFWEYIADLGDIAVILPAYLAATVALLLHRRHRDAMIWGMSLLACAAIAALLKIEIGSFKITVLGHGIRSASFPSGHASLALAFYGGLSLFLWYGSRSWLARLSALALLGLETLIAISVFVLGWHPVIDIVSGLLLGAMCVGAIYPIAATRQRTGTEITTILLAVILLVLTMHGARLDDQDLAGIAMRSGALPRS